MTALPAPFDGPVLQVDGITRTYGRRTVVNDVTFEVAAGELLTLVGPSGCGKSTLLRIIAGLERADRGRVVLAGREVSGLPAERRRIGLVFQEHALFGHLRVAQNVAFGLRHLSRRERTQRVGELLEMVRLAHVARRYPHELSGGEQQRIALARALAPRPDVVLLDEPFASLDELLRDEVRHDVTEVLAAQGTAAVLVTHDRDEALALGHRVAVMREGRLLQCDVPEEVYEHPADRFVAGFLAVTSFLPCNGDAGAGSVYVARPHDLAVVHGGDATVVARTYLGATHRYVVRRSDGVELVADHAPDGPLEVGDRCVVRVVADHPLHVLP